MNSHCTGPWYFFFVIFFPPGILAFIVVALPSCSWRGREFFFSLCVCVHILILLSSSRDWTRFWAKRLASSFLYLCFCRVRFFFFFNFRWVKVRRRLFLFFFYLFLCVSGAMHGGAVSSFCFPVSLSLSILILFILLALYTPNSCDFLFSQHEKEKAPFFCLLICLNTFSSSFFLLKKKKEITLFFFFLVSSSKSLWACILLRMRFSFCLTFITSLSFFFLLLFLFLIFSLVWFIAEAKKQHPR